MAELTEAEFKERMAAAEDAISKLVSFLRYDAEQRIRNRSFGNCGITLHWRDGMVTDAEVEEKHTMRTGKPGSLPGATVDTKTVRA